VDQPVVLKTEKRKEGEGGCAFHPEPATCQECTEERENSKIDQLYNYEQAEVTVTTKRRPVEGRTRRAKGGTKPKPFPKTPPSCPSDTLVKSCTIPQ
jgi:hypothetical protein